MKPSPEPSSGQTYRYVLRRIWQPELKAVGMILLNPSTADETRDDRTSKKCIRFAESWGYGSLIIVNLFAVRATYPEDMKAHANPVGPANDQRILSELADVDLVVAAWGNHGLHMGRGNAVKALIPNLHYLRMTKEDQPSHPLYLPKRLTPQPWN